MPRNSIMSGFGGTEKIKDARPLHDKSFVQQCIRQLHEVKTMYPTFCLDWHNSSWKLNFIMQRSCWQAVLRCTCCDIIKIRQLLIRELFALPAVCHIIVVPDWAGLHRHFVIQDSSVPLNQGVCKDVWVHLSTIRPNLWDANFKSWGGGSGHSKSPKVKCFWFLN